MQKPRVSIVVALGRNRTIGKDNKLLWHIPDDLKRFKALTLGHPVVMGRKTFESIVSVLGKALPGRTNIVVTHDMNWSYPEAVVMHSLEDALAAAASAEGADEIFIGGGTQIYEQALPFVDQLYLTLIDDEKKGDSFFPPYEQIFTKVISDESHDWNDLRYRWITLGKEAAL